MNRDKLVGKKKAAILMLSLGSDLSSRVFKHLSDEEIEELTLEIANLRKVDDKLRTQVMDEFYHICEARNYISHGGIKYAREILEKTMGKNRADKIIERLMGTLQVRPFEAVRQADPSQLLNFIQGEHPQTIALIIAYLEAEKASQILSSLPPEIQSDVSRRIALMDSASPEVIKDVEAVLEHKLSAIVSNDYASVGGIQTIVDVLNLADRGTEKNILDQLEEEDPELAEEIKNRMFVFEDIVLLSDRAVQLVMRQVDTHDIALALKTASNDVESKIYDNMSQRAEEMLKEDMDYMGPVRLREVEEAQQRVVNVIRQLEENGEIIIARGGESEMVV